MSARTKPTSCLNCGKTLDAMSVVEGDVSPPSDGDLAICLYCSHIHIFDRGGLRSPTDDEIVDMAGDPELLKVMQFNKLYNATFKRAEK